MEVQEALHLVAKDSVLRTLQIDISHILKSHQWALKLPVQRMRRVRPAFATLDEEPRTMAEERRRFHLADEVFAPIETKAFFDGVRADLLHNPVKASIFDESELENGLRNN